VIDKVVRWLAAAAVVVFLAGCATTLPGGGGMGQYRDGRVAVRNGTNLVKALWELQVTGAASLYTAQARVIGQTSGFVGIIHEHRLLEGVIAVEVLSGTPQVGEAIHAAVSTVSTSGTVTGGDATTLQDTAKDGIWVDDQWNGYWLRSKIGQPEEFQVRVIDTIAATPARVTYSGGEASAPGDDYEIHANQAAIISAFLRGTPQDWVDAGVEPGDYLLVSDLVPAIAIQAVAEDELTLATNWAGGDQFGVPYAVQRDFTARGYPLPRVGDTNIPAMLSQGFQKIDTDIATLFENAYGYGGSQVLTISGGGVTPSPLGGWDLVVDTEGGASTDNLDFIDRTDLPDDVTVIVRIAANTRKVTLRHNQTGPGKLSLRGARDLEMSSTDQWIELRPDGSENWKELRRGGMPQIKAAPIDGGMTAPWTVGLNVARWVRDPYGVVRMAGAFNNIGSSPISDNSLIWTMPSLDWPAAPASFVVRAVVDGVRTLIGLDVAINGEVRIRNIPAGDFGTVSMEVWVDGVAYSTSY